MNFLPSSRVIQERAGTTTLAADLAAINAAVAGKLATNGNGSALTGLTISQIADLASQLAGKLATNGNGSGLTGLTQSQVAGLVDALAGKADEAHTHGLGDVTGLVDSLNNLGGEIDALDGRLDTLEAAGGATIVESVLASDLVQTHSAGVYQTIFSVTLPVGVWSLESQVIHLRGASANVLNRVQAGTAVLAGAVGDPLGRATVEGSTIWQVNITATGTWTTTAASRSSAAAGASHFMDLILEVTTAGTILVQGNLNTSGTMTWKRGSLVRCRKVI